MGVSSRAVLETKAGFVKKRTICWRVKGLLSAFDLPRWKRWEGKSRSLGRAREGRAPDWAAVSPGKSSSWAAEEPRPMPAAGQKSWKDGPIFTSRFHRIMDCISVDGSPRAILWQRVSVYHDPNYFDTMEKLRRNIMKNSHLFCIAPRQAVTSRANGMISILRFEQRWDSYLFFLSACLRKLRPDLPAPISSVEAGVLGDQPNQRSSDGAGRERCVEGAGVEAWR